MKIKTRTNNTTEWNEIQLNKLQIGKIIYLNEKRERWESNSLNHIPFNYGCICNSENHLIFNIFMFGWIILCFGTEFFGDVGIVEYEDNY